MSINSKSSVNRSSSKSAKAPTARFDWSFLSNKKVRDAYKRFASGKSSAREIENELKNTDYVGAFRKLLRERGAQRARDAARLAVSRRTV